MNDSASKYYDKIAGVYDQATASDLAWTPPSEITKYAEEAVANAKRVLDIGIGTGQSIENLISKNPKAEFVGLDVSKEMIDKCSEKFPTVRLHHGDLKSFKNDNSATFDVIISSGAFEFIEDLSEVFSDVLELLSDSRDFFFTFEPYIESHKLQGKKKSLTVEDENSTLYTGDFYTYRRDLDEVKAMLNENGLSLIKQKEFVAYKKANTDLIYYIVHAKK